MLTFWRLLGLLSICTIAINSTRKAFSSSGVIIGLGFFFMVWVFALSLAVFLVLSLAATRHSFLANAFPNAALLLTSAALPFSTFKQQNSSSLLHGEFWYHNVHKFRQGIHRELMVLNIAQAGDRDGSYNAKGF